MAGSAKKPAKKALATRGPESTGAEHEWTELQNRIFLLYTRGFTGVAIARALRDDIVHVRHPAFYKDDRAKTKAARSRVRRTLQAQWFRDRLWEETVAKTDLAAPEIMNAMVREAKRGRVDAAKLALQVAGRYAQEEDKNSGNVQVVFANLIPRPDREGSQKAVAAASDEEEIEDADLVE